MGVLRQVGSNWTSVVCHTQHIHRTLMLELIIGERVLFLKASRLRHISNFIVPHIMSDVLWEPKEWEPNPRLGLYNIPPTVVNEKCLTVTIKISLKYLSSQNPSST